jgi:DNA polymerase-3 subunit epsilon
VFLAFRYEARRQKLLARAPPGPVRNYLEATWPALVTPLGEVPMMSLDLETSGLNPQKDEIVSVGWVLVDGGNISLASAQCILVKPRRHLPGSSVVIHGIGDDRAATGLPIREALTKILEQLSGRILLGHHIAMDAAFLNAACRGVGWGSVSIPCVDTLSLLERDARRRQMPIVAGAFSLAGARANCGLPRYPAHNALWDSIAAAELWLSQSARLQTSTRSPNLGDVVTMRS